MDCEDCTIAAQQRHHGFRSGCKGCAARAAARSPHFRRVRDNGMQDRAYRAMLDLYGVDHGQVKAAAAADFDQRGVAA